MEYFHTYMILVSVLYHLSWDMASSAKVSCPNIKFPNGRAHVRRKATVVSFKCNKNFELVGAKFAVCTDFGNWSQPIPVCVKNTCTKPDKVPGLIVEELNNGAILKFECGPGLSRSGPEILTCDGENWSDDLPKCVEGVSLECNFEEQGLCGWSQDLHDNFDWSWQNGKTPTADTGPSFDHTTNSSEGHYLFMEASAPQKRGQKARIISPSYAPEKMTDMCLEFFYHMYGTHDGPGEVGDLDVYVKPFSVTTLMLNESNSIFHQSGNQGNLWQRGYVKVPQMAEGFQIVFQATRQKSYHSDIAIDDVKLDHCIEETTTGTTVVKDPDENASKLHPEPTQQKTMTIKTATTEQVTNSTTTLLTKLPTIGTSFPATPTITSSSPSTMATTAATTSTSISTTTTTPRKIANTIMTTPRPTTGTITTKQPSIILTTPAASTAMAASISITPNTTATIETTTITMTDTPTTPTTTTTTTSTIVTTITTTETTPPIITADSRTWVKESKDKTTSDSDRDVDLTTALASAQTDPGYKGYNETDNSVSDNYDYDGDNRSNNIGDDDHGGSDYGNKDSSDEDSRNTSSPGDMEFNPTAANSTAFILNQSSARIDSLPSVTSHDDRTNEDHDGTTFSSRQDTDKTLDTNELSHGAVKKNDKDSSSNTKEMLPLIVGVAAAVLVAALVIGALAYMWARNQRRKQMKEQDDQMNIITEYVETNLSV